MNRLNTQLLVKSNLLTELLKLVVRDAVLLLVLLVLLRHGLGERRLVAAHTTATL